MCIKESQEKGSRRRWSKSKKWRVGVQSPRLWVSLQMKTRVCLSPFVQTDMSRLSTSEWEREKNENSSISSDVQEEFYLDSSSMTSANDVVALETTSIHLKKRIIVVKEFHRLNRVVLTDRMHIDFLPEKSTHGFWIEVWTRNLYSHHRFLMVMNCDSQATVGMPEGNHPEDQQASSCVTKK